MKISLNWLKDYIDTNHTPAQIAKILTMAGLEVDAVEKAALGFDMVVVGKVLEVQKHPEADKLCVATVTDGEQNYQVVCGAPNCRVGIKTALALVGATLTDETGKPFKIKKSKLRGVESFGMLCAVDELGLKGASEGIVEFSDLVKEGTDVSDLYGDTIFEISLTPNLGHCSSYIGVARELSAATGTPVRFPDYRLDENSSEPASAAASVDVVNGEACPRYTCRVIKNVVVGPSPDWLKARLEACGTRSINNVVDVTNYVMMEMGNPMHAFDYDRLEGNKIVVKNAQADEKFTTLDGKERVLSDKDLLICDAARPVALAGVMGGNNSEVTEQTKNILLEAAHFNPSVVRRTSKRLGLMTDASKRFERGTDPNVLDDVLNRAAMLIQQFTGGQVCQGIIDVSAGPFLKKKVTCRLSRINKVLGTHLSIGEVETVFQRLNFIFKWDNKDTFSVEVPTYRNDIHEEIDLVEEVARIYGYENIDTSSNRFHSSVIPNAPIFDFEREIRSRLVSEGLQEFLTCDLIGPAFLDIVQEDEMPEKAWVRVLNPTSIEQSVLRTSLLPGLLQVVKYNWDHQNQDIAGFELGRIHFKTGDQYKEQSVAGVILSGKGRPSHWDVKPAEFDFFDLKGIIENILGELKIPGIEFKASSYKTLHPGRQAAIFSGALEIGSLGEVHPGALRRLDVPQRILFAELNLHDLIQVKPAPAKMRDLPLYPGSERDLTLSLKEDFLIADVFTAIGAARSKLLENVSLLDVYRSDKLGKDIKNVTFRFVYRDWEKTISQEKVDAEHQRIVNNVLKTTTHQT